VFPSQFLAETIVEEGIRTTTAAESTPLPEDALLDNNFFGVELPDTFQTLSVFFRLLSPLITVYRAGGFTVQVLSFRILLRKVGVRFISGELAEVRPNKTPQLFLVWLHSLPLNKNSAL